MEFYFIDANIVTCRDPRHRPSGGDGDEWLYCNSSQTSNIEHPTRSYDRYESWKIFESKWIAVCASVPKIHIFKFKFCEAVDKQIWHVLSAEAGWRSLRAEAFLSRHTDILTVFPYYFYLPPRDETPFFVYLNFPPIFSFINFCIYIYNLIKKMENIFVIIVVIVIDL